MKIYLAAAATLALLLASCQSDDAIRRKEQDGALPPAGKTQAEAPAKATGDVVKPAESEEIATTTDTPVAPKSPPLIIKGSGAFENSAGLAEGEQQGTGTGDITLNFVDADIKDVVKGILGDILKATYVIDPNVAGHITIKTNEPLSRDELIPTLEQVLGANGIGLTQSNGKYRLTLLQDIKQVPLLLGERSVGYGNQIVRLHHVTATEMAKILEQYSQPGAIKTVESAPNLLILTGSGPDRANLLDIAGIFDVDRFNGMSFGIFQVSETDPQTMIDELTKVFTAGIGAGNLSDVMEFIPIDRQNAILVISADPARIEQVHTWIDRLDRRVPKDEPRLYVHYVQHGDAKQIASVLQGIFGGESDQNRSKPATRSVVPGATPVQMDSPGTGDIGQAMSMQDNSNADDYSNAPDDTGAAPAGGAYADKTADDSAATPMTMTIKGKGPLKGDIRITADNNNNALFILASPRNYKLINAAIQRLDITSLQVLIEATIAEVTLNDDLKYGVQWFLEQGDHSITLSTAATGAVAAAFPGFGYVFSGSQAHVVLSALAKVTEVKVISSPQLMVLDNRTARLQVGDEVPITTQTAVSVVTPDAPVVNNIEYRNTGVILSVTPRVNSSGTVGLEVEQEVSDVTATTTSGIDSPTIQQRKVKSTITVEDGQTIALGGLIRDKQTKDRSGLPWLMDIPILGNLFKTTDNLTNRTELLVLITPRVVRNPSDANDITNELRRRVEAVSPLGQKIQ